MTRTPTSDTADAREAPGWSLDEFSAMRTVEAIVFLVLICCTAQAGTIESSALEIEHLFGYLASSDCAFNRNGTWYSASEAVSHLREKYDYLLRKRLVTTAETFIERAASRSSVSGTPYLVRCGNAQPMESGTWFFAELLRFRATRRLAPS